MPTDWVFFTARPFLTGANAALGGTEQAIIDLTRALAASGDRVRVLGGATVPQDLGGVAWAPAASGPVSADRLVAVNDATLLRGEGRPFVWFHNEVELLKETRRGRMGALLRHRPTAVFIGTEQARQASRLFPFSARAVIPYGLPDRIVTAEPAAAPPGPHGVFTSQAYRGLTQVLAMWQNHVAPVVPHARFSAFIAAQDVPAFDRQQPGVTVTGRIANHAMPDMLRGARVWLAPGHRSETFCMAAAEAVAMGVPVVTLGIGALQERVRHGGDGFICTDMADMAARTIQVLTDDALWRRLHAAGIAARIGRGWAQAAQAWQAL